MSIFTVRALSATVRPWTGYPQAIAIVATSTAVSWWCRAFLSLPDVVTLYLLAITVVAARSSLGPSIVAATLSVAAYNYFFIPPLFALGVDDSRHLLTFAMMFAAALVTSTLIGRIRRQEQEAVVREERTRTLSELSERLAADAQSSALRAQTEEMRSALLSAVSHDLRTPLAAITGAATTLRDGPSAVSPAERAELVAMICDEAERLERLVGNLLYMTRIESDGFEVKREWTSLDELCGAAVERFETKAARDVKLDLPYEPVLVSVDPVLLEQVLLNLLDNAAKYAPGTRPIELSASVTGEAITLEVRDEGPGLPAGASEKVFEKFYRGTHPGAPGAGLGLSICRGIVEAHGGSISAHDRDGGGAVFRILLPIAKNAPPVRADEKAGAETGATT